MKSDSRSKIRQSPCFLGTRDQDDPSAALKAQRFELITARPCTARTTPTRNRGRALFLSLSVDGRHGGGVCNKKKSPLEVRGDAASFIPMHLATAKGK